jgi:flagellar L-ring protein precursor FlgH
VSVREKLPNGNLIIAGEKWIKLNKGDEFVRFSGEVRVSDIASDHSIDSILVGNSVIEISGKGEQQDNQEPSLLSKLLSIFG